MKTNSIRDKKLVFDYVREHPLRDRSNLHDPDLKVKTYLRPDLTSNQLEIYNAAKKKAWEENKNLPSGSNKKWIVINYKNAVLKDVRNWN